MKMPPKVASVSGQILKGVPPLIQKGRGGGSVVWGGGGGNFSTGKLY